MSVVSFIVVPIDKYVHIIIRNCLLLINGNRSKGTTFYIILSLVTDDDYTWYEEKTLCAVTETLWETSVRFKCRIKTF